MGTAVTVGRNRRCWHGSTRGGEMASLAMGQAVQGDQDQVWPVCNRQVHVAQASFERRWRIRLRNRGDLLSGLLQVPSSRSHHMSNTGWRKNCVWRLVLKYVAHGCVGGNDSTCVHDSYGCHWFLQDKISMRLIIITIATIKYCFAAGQNTTRMCRRTM